MARGNRDSAVRVCRGSLGFRDRRRTEREAGFADRDDMRVPRLIFRGVSLVVRYHEAGETDPAFDALRLGAESLAEAADRLGLGVRRNAAPVLDPIADEVGLMYDALTADRLVQALRQCFDSRRPDGSG